MSECTVPSWNLSHQSRQEVAGEEGNRSSSHVHNNQPHHPGYIVPMSNYEVAELTRENGQLTMHGLTGILPAPAAKAPTFGRAGDTLESIVHQATCYKHNEKTSKQLQEIREQAHINPIAAATSGGKRGENTAGNMQMSPGLVTKRLRSSDSDQCGRYNFSRSSIRSLQEDQVGSGAAERSACASASATFCRDIDATTMMTWASFESPGSLKTKTTDEDSACHDGSENRDEELETKGETFLSQSAKRSRAATVHNQSERRRRDRINQKMKALQKLVPNASKTDKASMLDEVIEYLKQLKAQVHMMSTRNMPQMMMNPLAMQQQLQMSLLARMGMGFGLGMGMGMLDVNALARSSSHPLQSSLIPNTAPMATATPTFLPPHFVVPTTAVPPCSPSQAKSRAEAATINTAAVPFSHPYMAFLAQQSMNMDFYNKMAALYRQEASQATQSTSNPSQASFIQRE